MSKVDIYSITGETSQEEYIALDSDATQAVSGVHSRAAEKKKIEEKNRRRK